MPVQPTRRAATPYPRKIAKKKAGIPLRKRNTGFPSVEPFETRVARRIEEGVGSDLSDSGLKEVGRGRRVQESHACFPYQEHGLRGLSPVCKPFSSVGRNTWAGNVLQYVQRLKSTQFGVDLSLGSWPLGLRLVKVMRHELADRYSLIMNEFATPSHPRQL